MQRRPAHLYDYKQTGILGDCQLIDIVIANTLGSSSYTDFVQPIDNRGMVHILAVAMVET